MKHVHAYRYCGNANDDTRAKAIPLSCLSHTYLFHGRCSLASGTGGI